MTTGCVQEEGGRGILEIGDPSKRWQVGGTGAVEDPVVCSISGSNQLTALYFFCLHLNFPASNSLNRNKFFPPISILNNFFPRPRDDYLEPAQIISEDSQQIFSRLFGCLGLSPPVPYFL